jgi:hypothetical protein
MSHLFHVLGFELELDLDPNRAFWNLSCLILCVTALSRHMRLQVTHVLYLMVHFNWITYQANLMLIEPHL